MELFILKVSLTNEQLEQSAYSFNAILLIKILIFIAREILPLWDKQIQSICYQVNGVIEKIGASEPEWMAKKLDEEMTV